MATVLVRVVGAQKYASLARRLRAAGQGDLRRRLNDKIRIAGAPAVDAVRDAVRAVEVESSAGGGTKSTGLRERIAAATEVNVTARGIRIRVVERRVEPGYRLARKMNADGNPWVHGLFNNQERQYVQTGQEFFRPTLLGFAAAFRRGVEDAMDEIAAQIDG